MKSLRDYKSVLERRRAIEKHRRVDLNHIGSFTLNETVAAARNCENMIGAAQIPMGIAGPLRLTGVRSGQAQNYYVPLATTEGALVASVNRGCKAITGSGGAAADSYRVGATRGPVFKVKNIEENKKLYEFLKTHVEDLRKITGQTSKHINLEKLTSRGVGKYRYVRFVFDTQDAMGMNMVTIATQKLVEFIETKTGCRCISLAGNYDVDKKPSWLNVIEGRGIKAWAEVTIPDRILKGVLKTTAKKMYDVWLAKCMMGSAMSGSMAFNAQYANVVAALFLATGQDIAHVVEGSLGITTAEVMKEDLYVSVYLPDLMVGTVGGGTGLATQKEAFQLLGVEHSQNFAEIVAGAVLAGEISLLASLSEGTLAKAHEVLARGKE
ncbi:MAG: hydroxymethylglutaryl-CoA reductase [Candidatus Gottesmanbacteria bacterium]|nr:hydroxymethylglutaryl-CoA reductase [Candidatus Gottesmanbacteria bacterium]